MKESNKTKYLLGVSLIGVWGLLGFRFYEKVNPQSPTLVHSPNHLISEIREEELFDFELSKGYNNPFVNGRIKPPISNNRFLSNSNVQSKRINIKSKAKVNTVRFPEIQYKGNIVDDKGKMTAVVKINQEFLNLTTNQEFEGIQITKIYPDSIVVEKEGNNLTISK